MPSPNNGPFFGLFLPCTSFPSEIADIVRNANRKMQKQQMRALLYRSFFSSLPIKEIL